MRILITGGTGFLGQALTESLLRSGHDVILATRNKNTLLNPYPTELVEYPLTAEFIAGPLQKIDACIHLAGESISGRWTSAKKVRIQNSRWQDTDQLVKALQQSPSLKVFLSASAIGIYGHRNDEELTESSAPGQGFLADVCRGWEARAQNLKGIRTVLLRTGIVLGRNHGALGELELLFKNQMGGAVGSGEQFMSWIHISDWVSAVHFCLNNSNLSGPVNIVAPNPVTNREFSRALCKLHNYNLRPTVPGCFLKLALGEMAALVLDSQRVQPQKLLANQFKFNFYNIDEALKNLFGIDQGGSAYDFVFEAAQFVPRSLNETFKFFENEQNLETLTPQFLNFKVLRKSTPQIQAGTLIDYKLRVHGLPIYWRTQIENWQPPQMFSDTQLKGPYHKWHHTHIFESFKNGTLMKDRVYYQLPLGILGRIFARPFVQKDVQKIFSYRKKRVQELFG